MNFSQVNFHYEGYDLTFSALLQGWTGGTHLKLDKRMRINDHVE